MLCRLLPNLFFRADINKINLFFISLSRINATQLPDYYEILIFGLMQLANVPGILVEANTITSAFLKKDVQIDVYLPRNVTDPSQMSLLLKNNRQKKPKKTKDTKHESKKADDDAI